MKTTRQIKTLCPVCVADLNGFIAQKNGKVYLSRHCPEHGLYEHLLSNNGELYSDLDKFYFDVLKGDKEKGQIVNYWVLSTSRCQMKCRFCQVQVEKPIFDEMTSEDFSNIFKKYKTSKLTLSGGEPTLHPDILGFFKKASAQNLTTQLATNGILLADKDFCKKLADSGVKEVRISIESFDEKGQIAIYSDEFYSPKLDAINNLRDCNITTILSPTIFKGINETLLVETLEFAKDEPFIKEISVNGFSWVGEGRGMDKNLMIMPDEMMDILYRHYFTSDREDIFTFQRLIFIALQLLGIRICLYTQIMMFVRTKKKLVPITEFLNMKRMKAGINWWGRFSKSPFLLQVISFMFVCLISLKLKSIKVFPPALILFFANVFKVKINKYPSTMLPVVLNTNCSTLSADKQVGLQCMSGFLYKKNGDILEDKSTRGLLKREKEHVQQAGTPAIEKIQNTPIVQKPS